jgi:hypothetical protein
MVMGSAKAQEATIAFQFNPPYDKPLEDYKDQLTLNFTVGRDRVSGFLGISIYNDDRSVTVNSTLPGRKRLTLNPGVTTLTGSDLDDLLDVRLLQFTGVDPTEVFYDTGLPPGRYTLCFQMYNAANESLSNNACMNFQINIPPVSGSMVFLPPFNVPFDAYSDQVTTTFVTTASFRALLQLSVTSSDGSIALKKQMNVTLESGSNIFSGSTLDPLFSQGGFLTLTGITENRLFGAGLPQGGYSISFSLISDNVSLARTEQQFSVPVTSVVMRANVNPPNDAPLQELLSQTTLTLSATRSIQDAFMTLIITGDGIQIESSPAAIKERVSLETNIPETIPAGDLIDIEGTGVTFTGVSQADAVNHGLPGGNYSYCFQFWDNDGRLLTQERTCASLNVPETTIRLVVNAIPPYTPVLEDIYNMLMVTATANRKVTVGFTAKIESDNGIVISGQRSNTHEPIELEKNVPFVLSIEDLRSYFDPDFLTFSGADKTRILDHGLPEGNYQLCLSPYLVEGYPIVSEESCTNFHLSTIEPPQLLTPECGQTIDVTQGQFVVFNWMPAPGAPRNETYTLKIVEMRIPDQNPMDALLTSTSPAFFEEQVAGTSFLYGPGEPLLEPGQRYAYQVYMGDEPARGNFTNQGLSQACFFTVIDNTIPADVREDSTKLNRKIVVKPIAENPFPGFAFPVTKVSGMLQYMFKGLVLTNQQENNQQESIQIEEAKGVDKSLSVKTNPGLSPPFNENTESTRGSLPLKGTIVKLQAGYLLYGKHLGKSVSGKFISTPGFKTIASTTTDANGNFDFVFMQTDSLGGSHEIPLFESKLMGISGTAYNVFRLVVESPYYCSPDINIVVQPWEHIDLGTLVSYVKSYNLKVIVKTGAKGSFFADQSGGVGVTIPDAKTQIKRSSNVATIPENEGQNLGGNLVAEGTTNANGSIVFKNLVRHSFNNPLDKYTITCETSKYKGEYNFQTNSHSYPLSDHPSEGPYSYAPTIDFNSDWTTQLYVDTITMFPKLPRVFGEVNGQQPPAELTQPTQNINSPAVDISFTNSSSNGSAQNMLSTSLYQSNMSVSAFTGILQKDPNWSEKVNKAPLPDVKVTLLETYRHWQEYDGKPFDKLQKQTDSNGQFSFDKLNLEVTEELKVDGPARVMIIQHPGYKQVVKHIPLDGFLKWGQQYEVKDILLEPNGFVYGYVEDEKGNPVKAEVFIGEFTSATTVQSQEFQDILGISGPLKELFIIKAPSGGNVKLHIVPDNPIYVPEDYHVDIDENNTKIPQNLGGFKVDIYKHRIMLQVTEEKVMTVTKKMVIHYPPVKNALVKVTNLATQGPATNSKMSQPSNSGPIVAQQGNQQLIDPDNAFYGYTDGNGFVTLTFTNNSQEFEIEVIPPLDKDLEKLTTSISSEPSGKPVFAKQIILGKAWSISGTVTYGNDSLPLANARVYIDDDVEVFTNSSGKYTLKYISQIFDEYTITAENHKNPLTLIAESKTVQMPFSGSLNFNLTEFDDFEIKELMGIPVTVKNIKPDGNNYLLDGSFIDLPANDNFSTKEKNAQLKFYQVPITSIQKNGKLVAKALNNTITLDEKELDLINYTKFVAKQESLSENQLLIMQANPAGLGNLTGKVTLSNSSFQFGENYMSFNEETSSPSNGPNYLAIQLPGNTAIDKQNRVYINLFDTTSQILLFNSQQNSVNVKTLSAADYPLQPFQISDQENQDYVFKIQDFIAKARKNESYVFRDTLVLATSLIADGIPLALPKTLEVNAGNIRVSAYGFEKILGEDPLTFKLEQWQITCDNWSLTPTVSGIIAPTGKINFGVFTTEIKGIKITPNNLELGNLNIDKFKLGDIVPITIKAGTVAFDIDSAAGSDNKPHWFLSVIGFNNNPAASIKGLPGMNPADEINMQEVLLLSNGEEEMIIGNQGKPLTFYNIIKVTPDQFTVLNGGLQLSASLDLEIPLLKKSYGSFRYTKQNNVITSQFLGMDVDFTMPGNTMFVGGQNLGDQILEPNKFEAIGYVKHEEQVKLFSRMVKNLDSTYIYVDPLHQTLAIADDGSNYMAEVTGGTRALQNDWNKFVFSGDLTGMKGVEDSKKRKTFTINGSINAENEGLDVKNISADFGGMKITYDFPNARLTGSLDFEQDFASVQITGHADFLTDADGWLFIAGGSLTTPGFGQLNAGLGIGDYGNMTTLIDGQSIKDRLLKEAYNKNLPSAFQNGFSGFYFTALKTIPQLSVPETGFDFLLVSGSIELKTGFDARVWMGFDDDATEFGIGVMAFAELTLMLDVSITCTSLYGYLGLQLLVEGKYNTGSGVFSLDGCASITLAGALEQGLPNPITGCEEIGSTCGSVGLKATMHFDSNNNIDAGFALGSCSGGEPLTQEIKDKFNCN